MAARLAIAVQLMLESRRVRLPRRGALYGVRAEARRTRHEGVKYRPVPARTCHGMLRSEQQNSRAGLSNAV